MIRRIAIGGRNQRRGLTERRSSLLFHVLDEVRVLQIQQHQHCLKNSRERKCRHVHYSSALNTCNSSTSRYLFNRFYKRQAGYHYATAETAATAGGCFQSSELSISSYPYSYGYSTSCNERNFNHHSLQSIRSNSTSCTNTKTTNAPSSSLLLPPSISIDNFTSLPQNLQKDIQRLQNLRNVGVFAHVDAGKTTVTERMLALAGIIQRAGSVDTGNTVTDYLPAERERGITIQSAAISFHWHWIHNKILSMFPNGGSSDSNGSNDSNDSSVSNDEVTIQLIDTPGHVDFSVEVNRSVAVLDGAVLVIDAVAGVQAQTETVWRAMTHPRSMNHHPTGLEKKSNTQQDISSNGYRYGHGHEPLPCVAFINKMDKEGCNFAYALSTLRHKLSHANPVAIQIPLFQIGNTTSATTHDKISANILAVAANDTSMNHVSNGRFVGVIDIVEMRAIIWPEVSSSNVSIVEECIPSVINLTNDEGELIDPESQVGQMALSSRTDLVASLADIDEQMEEFFLMEEDPTNDDLRLAIRRATLSRKMLPVMTGAALRGKGVEPLLDAVADFLPSPIERLPPTLNDHDEIDGYNDGKRRKKSKKISQQNNENKISFGHPLHPSLLALAFKVVHMKSKGSGDGRVVFARIYSGKISSRDTLKVITPSIQGEIPEKPRTERVGGMLQLSGGQFDNLKEGVCYSGNVCALVGLKSVVTGDTIQLASDGGSSKKSKKKKDESTIAIDTDYGENLCLAGVASPKPVLTVRIEAESSEQQTKLSDALKLLTAEDPSLVVEENDSVTLLSGLGELHIEVILDRLKREHALPVWVGKPSVAYRETVDTMIETNGLEEYDRTIGAARLQSSIHLQLEPILAPDATNNRNSSSMILSEPIVTIGSKARQFLGLDLELLEDELAYSNDAANALIAGCKGALMRGPLGSYGIVNVKCHIVDVDAEGGLSYLTNLPGALRAASSTIITSLLMENKSCCSVLEPTMSIEITAPTDMVGTVLSDLTSRRGTVGEVFMGDDNEKQTSLNTKALIHGEVPLSEILGYANTLRSITGGEGTFTAEYVGHSHYDSVN